MQQYDAFIVAGGRSPWLKEICGTEYRCLAQLNGRRLIDYITEALLSSGCIRRLVIAASPEAVPLLEGTLPAAVQICASAGDLPATTILAAKQLGADSSAKILGVCDDIPLLTAGAVRNFIEQCEKYPSAQLYYPIIPKGVCLKQFPSAQRTYGKVKDGVFTGGNMMLMDKDIIPKGQQKAREIFALRKSPLRLANWLGWKIIIKALCGCLTIKEAEQRFSDLMDISSKAVISPCACIGMDVDKPQDLELAQQALSRQK